MTCELSGLAPVFSYTIHRFSRSMRFGSRRRQPVANVAGAESEAGFGSSEAGSRSASGFAVGAGADADGRVVGRRGGRGWDMRPSVGGVVSVCGRVV